MDQPSRGQTTEAVIRGKVPGITPQYTLEGHTNTVYIVAWSPDGKLLASGSRDNKLRIWDTSTGKPQHTISHKNRVFCIAWSPDSRFLASGARDDDKTVRLWVRGSGEMRRFEGHTSRVHAVAWSPDGKLLASGSNDRTVRLWDPDQTQGEARHILAGHTGAILCMAWSPNGKFLATGSSDGTIRLWDPDKGALLHILKGHSQPVNTVAWHPKGKLLASGANDGTVRLWNPATPGDAPYILGGHKDGVLCVAWPPDGKLLASGAHDATVRLWNEEGKLLHILEGHTSTVWSAAWSPDGKLLASGANSRSPSYDAEVRIWRTATWEPLVALSGLKGSLHADWHPRFPDCPLVATPGRRKEAIFIWHLNQKRLSKALPSPETMYYANAKVVLVGESGVGKTALGLALTKHPYTRPDSTHSRHVYTFDERTIAKEQREIYLWDLAGQTGYRLIHQLHLNEVAVALIVFSDKEGGDPLTGVSHWARSLGAIQSVQDSNALPIKKLLVEARIDRGHVRISRGQIDETMQKFGFDGYYETSAKNHTGIDDLSKAIQQAIDWNSLHKVISTELFQRIKAFLVRLKADHQLLKASDLYHRLITNELTEQPPDLRAQFDTCLGRLEAQGLIWRLSFGERVLLQPELLDAYASALVNAIRADTEELGSIAEARVLGGDFALPSEGRLADRGDERLLLLAMVEDLVRYEVAFREGNDLVFPSEVMRRDLHALDPPGKTIIFTFEGPVLNIYATLAVRLSHSGIFHKKALWQNCVEFVTGMGGTCGIALRMLEEGEGEFTLFFDEKVSEEMRYHFEEYVRIHLERHAAHGTIARRRIFICPQCKTPFHEQQVTSSLDQKRESLLCPVCRYEVPLLDREERLGHTPASLIPQIDEAANERKESEAAKSMIQGKIKTGEFDVFLCYNNEDKDAVKEVGKKLKERNIRPWLDEWESRPGQSWQRLLEKQIERIKSAAVFVGENGIGPWQRNELDAFLREFNKRECPVIPVILSNVSKVPDLPVFLGGMTWVDFRERDPDPMERLIWGITGKREIDE